MLSHGPLTIDQGRQGIAATECLCAVMLQARTVCMSARALMTMDISKTVPLAFMLNVLMVFVMQAFRNAASPVPR